jgi:hypothetical protein
MPIAEDRVKWHLVLESNEAKAPGFTYSAEHTAFLVFDDHKVEDFAILGEVVIQLPWVTGFYVR